MERKRMVVGADGSSGGGMVGVAVVVVQWWWVARCWWSRWVVMEFERKSGSFVVERMSDFERCFERKRVKVLVWRE
jgi:hypothetical protein